MSDKKIVIIGAGPTGLGAALRLTEMGHANWDLYDAGAVPGGLSRSYQDSQGFTWDLGGHVIFSHYAYFDDAMNLAVQEWNTLQRESWVRVAGVWAPYPFQYNIHRLPPAERDRCLRGLEEAAALQTSPGAPKPATFEDTFALQFGAGITELFMRPYNFKVWAVPASTMSTEWVGERVAQVDLARVRRCIDTNTDDVGWGPNATFRYPQHGGTGGIYTALQSKLPRERFSLGDGSRAVGLDVAGRRLRLASGEVVAYDALISTVPLDDLLRMTAEAPAPLLPSAERLRQVADSLVFSTTHVIGLGIRGSPPAHLRTACWLYFADPAIPFYRVTVLSNYAASNAPAGHWSLMLEVSENARHKAVDAAAVVEDCVRGCLAADLLTTADAIVSRWHHVERKGYPVPFLGRNALLEEVLPALRDHYRVYSRGRFGGWKYEVANQDHSLMQGVEAVDHILGLESEGGAEPTFHTPGKVNSTRGTRRLEVQRLQ